MPLLDGDFFINSEIYSMPFSDLQNAKLGVEATYYLQQLTGHAPAHEPLLAALGGDPIALKHHIKSDLDQWKENGMTPLFVFEGQAVTGKEEIALQAAQSALTKTNRAWELYTENHPEDAVKTFGASGAVRAQDLCRILQEVLAERNIEFIIAPFSACAQLARLDRLDEQYIDGIMGSQELLLYDIHDAIIFPPTPLDWEKKSFSGTIKSELIKKLNVTPEMFADALLMVGTSFLPPFPPLQDEAIITRQPYSIVDAANLLRTSEKSVTNTCAAFSDVLQRFDPNWLDKYRKAKMSVKHCPTISPDGVVSARDYDNLTGDSVEYLGLQLPPELYHYLSKALIGPRIMNYWVSLECVIYPTLDGVHSDEYKTLLSKTLVPLKEAALALISPKIHRGFQFKDVAMKFWFDDSLKRTIVFRNQSKANEQADTWGVRDSALTKQEAVTGTAAGKLSFALLSLEDKEFSAQSISKEKVTDLKSKAEILSNTLWRFLHVRGYINDKHELTSWGRALAVTLRSLVATVNKYEDIHHVEEAAFLAFELIQFDNLNSRNRHTELIGGPLRGSDEDKENCLLIGRIACLLKLRHRNIGYTGPLSTNLLSFYSIIKAVRETDRDLLEGVTAAMFLSSQASRNQDDFGDLGRSLPFLTDVDIGLGIAVKTYLDDFLKEDSSPEERAAGKSKYAEKLLPHSVNFAEDLDVAFDFFDAIYAGVKTLVDDISDADKKSWDAAKTYLDKRR